MGVTITSEELMKSLLSGTKTFNRKSQGNKLQLDFHENNTASLTIEFSDNFGTYKYDFEDAYQAINCFLYERYVCKEAEWKRNAKREMDRYSKIYFKWRITP